MSKTQTQPNGCWHWKMGKTKDGYGVIRINCVMHYAHRLSWQLFRGPIPDGHLVCRNCPSGDNPACCNPDHLFTGTHRDNTRDALKKGRLQPQAETFRRLWREKWKPGEGRPNHKLTNEQVIEMRRLHREEKWGYKRLRKHFGVAFGTAQAVINRWSWKHIP